jgi:hypothetical protein
MASVVSIWIKQLDGMVPKLGNTLALTDNSGCVGWLHQNNFYNVTHPVEVAITHQLADCCIDHNTMLHSQNIKGTLNVVADALSWKFELSDTQLTHYCAKSFPFQLPQGFRNMYNSETDRFLDLLQSSSSMILH